MGEIRLLSADVDQRLEERARAKQRLDAERWQAELRPRVMRRFATRARTLTWSRALVKAVVEELHPDDLFTELVGHLDRIPPRRWPYVIAIGVALRHSWRPDSLARIARRLQISLTAAPHTSQPLSRSRPSRIRVSRSPRSRQGASLRSAPARRGSRP